MLNLELLLASPYILSFLLIVILFKIFDWKVNPFKRLRFWITQIVAVVIITIIGLLIIRHTMQTKHSSDENLTDDIESETVIAITIIQMKDTVHIKYPMHFFELLTHAELSGPLKYRNKGKIIFTRMDGRRDSLNTNGSAFGPYKGKWYRSTSNVLKEYFVDSKVNKQF